MNANLPQLEAVFHDALARCDAAERTAYLNSACAENAELRNRVEELLTAYAERGEFLGGTSGATGEFAERAETSTVGLGTLVADRYKLLEVIGEGGMGTVFVAEQIHPVRRNVAVKIIKAGLDSKAVLARFEAERQTLALMEHPNIARVLDAGTTEKGLPFFVMELVKGTPITTFCDANRLSPRQRLELFIPVCQAIQHAHQKGVIHRDIKPSNVLVALYDDKPVPKVIDFGVAKAAGQPLTEKTLNTAFGAIVGTPEYMSPEQATFNQLDIDTRSDVYSLGVLLYELLTGTTPVDQPRFKAAALLEVLRVVREDEPPRPSVKLSTTQARAGIAATRGTEPDKLAQLLRGELDWIVMKSLEKDRERRYETANALARDLERYLKDELVEARPPTAAYRLRKFVTRNHGKCLAAALAVVALLLTAFFASRVMAARNERRLAAEMRAFEMVRLGKDQDALAATADAIADAEAAGVESAQIQRFREQLQARQASRNRPGERLEYWLYPQAKGPSCAGDGVHLGVYTTRDSLEQVVGWYEKKLGREMTVDTPGNVAGGGLATIGDSFAPWDGNGTPRRAVKIGIATRNTDSSVLTLVVNRLENEEATHIIVSFVRK